MIVLSTDLRTKIHELLSRLRKVQNTTLMITIKCREFSFKKNFKTFFSLRLSKHERVAGDQPPVSMEQK